MTVIDTVSAGEIIDPDWGNSIADFLNGAVEDNTYTPTLVNAAVGTGGSASNSAHYVYVGGPATGDKGVLHVYHTIVLGTSGASVTGTVTATLPSGFEFAPGINSNLQRWASVSYVAGGVTAFGPVLRQGTNVVGYQVFNAASTYLAVSNISATVPGTWVAGDSLRANYTVPVVRV